MEAFARIGMLAKATQAIKRRHLTRRDSAATLCVSPVFL